MKFVPDPTAKQSNVPFLDDANSKDGWQGHATNESPETLRSQISAEINRLGGTVTRWMPGLYEIEGKERVGVQIGYQIIGQNGAVFEGRIDVAGLPWQKPYNGDTHHGGYKTAVKNKKKKSLAMALYNVREALQAMRILQILSPGYAALVPWMLKPGTDMTIGEMWNIGSPALPAPDDDGEIVDGSFEVKEEE